jgi:hypothetical protein
VVSKFTLFGIAKGEHEYTSVAEHLPSMLETLNSVPSSKTNKKPSTLRIDKKAYIFITNSIQILKYKKSFRNRQINELIVGKYNTIDCVCVCVLLEF